jgi:hypothetical protein
MAVVLKTTVSRRVYAEHSSVLYRVCPRVPVAVPEKSKNGGLHTRAIQCDRGARRFSYCQDLKVTAEQLWVRRSASYSGPSSLDAEKKLSASGACSRDAAHQRSCRMTPAWVRHAGHHQLGNAGRFRTSAL